MIPALHTVVSLAVGGTAGWLSHFLAFTSSVVTVESSLGVLDSRVCLFSLNTVLQQSLHIRKCRHRFDLCMTSKSKMHGGMETTLLKSTR